jgi:hypothetical protein
VIVSGVTDRAVAGNVINVFSDVQLTVPTLPTMVVELYTGMGGNAWTDLVRFSKFLDHTPDVVSVSNTYFGFNTNLSDSGLNDYGGRIYSYFVAPSNGTYVFYVKGDDGVRLAMNTNSVGSTNPAGAFIIASTNAFFDVNYRADSSKSLPVTLTSNQLYYIEALWKEGGGGDGIGVTFRAAADPTVPPNGEIALASSFRLPGDLLGSSPIGAITVGTVPASQNVNEGQSAAFSVDNVNGAYPRTFQWQRSDGSGGFTNIPGATSTSFQIAVAQAGHNGAQFRLVASNPFSSVTTAPPATLTVSPDVVAPLLASAGTFDGINIGIKFTEQTALDPSVATNINQYIVDGGPTVTNPLGIVSARLLPNGNSVVLTLSNVVTTNAFTVTVLSTKDTSPQANVGGVQNVIGRYPTNTTSILWPGTPQPGSAVAFGDGATYEITAGGNDIWGTQDQGRYVYQSRAGDFDARVKVDSLSIPANGEATSIAKAGLMLRVTAESNSPTLHILANPPPPGRNQQEGGAPRLWEVTQMTGYRLRQISGTVRH